MFVLGYNDMNCTLTNITEQQLARVGTVIRVMVYDFTFPNDRFASLGVSSRSNMRVIAWRENRISLQYIWR